jgi:hypothetical protein
MRSCSQYRCAALPSRAPWRMKIRSELSRNVFWFNASQTPKLTPGNKVWSIGFLQYTALLCILSPSLSDLVESWRMTKWSTDTPILWNAKGSIETDRAIRFHYKMVQTHTKMFPLSTAHVSIIRKRDLTHVCLRVDCVTIFFLCCSHVRQNNLNSKSLINNVSITSMKEFHRVGLLLFCQNTSTLYQLWNSLDTQSSTSTSFS